MWQTDSTWVCDALKTSRDVRRYDIEHNARLDAALKRQAAASVDDRGERRCRECHQQLAHTLQGDICAPCRHSTWMRENRKPLTQAQRDRRNELRRAKRVEAARAKLAAKGIHL